MLQAVVAGGNSGIGKETVKVRDFCISVSRQCVVTHLSKVLLQRNATVYMAARFIH
jgi:hypothetical protein